MFKNNYGKENEGNKFMSQLTDLRKKLLDQDKKYRWKALTIYINGTEFKSDGSNLLLLNNINIPGGLINMGFGADLKFIGNTRNIEYYERFC